jgi:hypothetical protein
MGGRGMQRRVRIAKSPEPEWCTVGSQKCCQVVVSSRKGVCVLCAGGGRIMLLRICVREKDEKNHRQPNAILSEKERQMLRGSKMRMYVVCPLWRPGLELCVCRDRS